MDEIFLTDRAFIGIIVSSVEVFRNECLGLVLGYKESDRMTVEYAIPFQSAKRKKGSVEANVRRDTMCKELLPELSHLEQLGYYHSHTQYGNSRAVAEPSKQDLLSMVEGSIDIILAVNKTKRRKDWTMDARGVLSGTIGDFAFAFAAHHYHSQKREWKQVRIVCPYAVGFNRALERSTNGASRPGPTRAGR
jgi:proteasome lid subunit RPN8/RPN11